MDLDIWVTIFLSFWLAQNLSLRFLTEQEGFPTSGNDNKINIHLRYPAAAEVVQDDDNRIYKNNYNYN